MKNTIDIRNNIKNILNKNNVIRNIIILIASIMLLYLLISIYFSNHFFFNTTINGVDVSLKAHDDVENIFKNYLKNYKLQIIERYGWKDEISGEDIKIQYNGSNFMNIFKLQKSYIWISSLFKEQKYYIKDLYKYDINYLNDKINELHCLNTKIIEPQNVSFQYLDGSYYAIKEIYGNKINKDKLYESINNSILKGDKILYLNDTRCYENPKFTLSTEKTAHTMNILNKYVSTNITYIFGNEREVLNGDIINKWLSVNDNLDVVINEKSIKSYVKQLCNKYDTVGAPKLFKTSTGKTIEVEGGFYGWKINPDAVEKAIFESILRGDVIEIEPVYTQRAIQRGEDEIGNTYLEINITWQHIWFYKNGKLIAQGPIVTGNPNKGNATKTGTYMLNYKQKGTTLRGPGYEAGVTYWMPFNGNIGIHDASWRKSFGGDIYLKNGSHGCVNVPFDLAKTIFENIEPGTPVVCY